MRGFGLAVLLFAAPTLAQTPSPVPTTMSEDGTTTPPSAPVAKDDTFDPTVARAALAGVGYKDCGKGGAGKVLITFATDGTVERVVLAEGSYQPPVAVCVTRRFSLIGIAPFTGKSHTVQWSIALEGGPAPAPTGATYSAPPPAEYAYNYGPVIDATESAPPPGYHVEERRKAAPLIAGSIVGGFGLMFTALSLSDDRNRSRDENPLLIAGVLHLAIGLPLFFVGLGTKRVFVANNTVSLVPSYVRGGGTAALSITF